MATKRIIDPQEDGAPSAGIIDKASSHDFFFQFHSIISHNLLRIFRISVAAKTLWDYFAKFYPPDFHGLEWLIDQESIQANKKVGLKFARYLA